jgi:hypothetical protein
MQHKGENRVHRLWYKEKREKIRNIYKESLGISSGMPVPPYTTRHPPPENSTLLPPLLSSSTKNFRTKYAEKKATDEGPI